MEAEISVHTLFGALTRPPMSWGVTYEYHALNLMASVIGMIGLGRMVYLLMFLPLHAFGWAVCKYDIHFFSLMQKKLYFLPNHPHKTLWGVRCYEPF